MAIPRDLPLLVTGLNGKEKPLYFRGRRILDAVLESLLVLGLREAENVMLTGCSSGGLATFLHADYVHGWLSSAGSPLKRFGVVPFSGFFLLHSNVEGMPIYAMEIRRTIELANSTRGLSGGCLAALADEDHWKCHFAEYAYSYVRAPIFVLNSALDSWSIQCILAAELAPGFTSQRSDDNGICSASLGWFNCTWNPEECNTSQIDVLNTWIADFESVITVSDTYGKAGNGAFIHSCHTHCEAQQSLLWNTFAVDGVTMRQAVSKWWHSNLSEPADLHTYRPCAYHTAGQTRRCNPTCAPRPHTLTTSLRPPALPLDQTLCQKTTRSGTHCS